MNREELFEAIGQIGDDLIVRADRAPAGRRAPWVRWAALAACCALVVSFAALALPGFFSAKSAAPAMDSAATANEAAPQASEPRAAHEEEYEAEMKAEASPSESPAEEAPAEEPAGAQTPSGSGAAGQDAWSFVTDTLTLYRWDGESWQSVLLRGAEAEQLSGAFETDEAAEPGPAAFYADFGNGTVVSMDGSGCGVIWSLSDRAGFEAALAQQEDPAPALVPLRSCRFPEACVQAISAAFDG